MCIRDSGYSIPRSYSTRFWRCSVTTWRPDRRDRNLPAHTSTRFREARYCHLHSECSLCAWTQLNNQFAATSVWGRQPYQPWEVIAVELMAPSSWGRTGILMITVLFSWWVEAFPIPEATTGCILTILRTEVFNRYDYPQCLLTDSGCQFTSHQCQKALAKWGIEHWITPIYNPMGNQIEWWNQELKRMLRIYLVDEEHKTWDQHRPQSLVALCQKVSRITVYSQFMDQLYRIIDWGISQPTEKDLANPEAWL